MILIGGGRGGRLGEPGPHAGDQQDEAGDGDHADEEGLQTGDPDEGG